MAMSCGLSFPVQSAALTADGTQNAVHGSDSAKSAQREIKFFFPHRPSPHIPLAPGGKVKIPASLEETLCRGLTVLSRTKPSHDPMAALAWLGNWLLDNNPNKPKVVAPQDLELNNIDDGSVFGPPAAAEGAAAEDETVSIRSPPSRHGAHTHEAPSWARARQWHASGNLGPCCNLRLLGRVRRRRQSPACSGHWQ